MIDLATLPRPEIIESLDYESILADVRADLVRRQPELRSVLALESEPVTKLCEAFAYRELTLRAQINEIVRSCLLAYASGGALDHLAALLGTVRRPEESDADVRSRTQSAFERLSVAGPIEAYRAHARAADKRVVDISVSSPVPGEVLIYVLASAPDDSPSADLLATVEAAVNADTVRPLTDKVRVRPARAIAVDVTARIQVEAGSDGPAIIKTARAGLTAHFDTKRKIGEPLARSGLIAAMHVAGVVSVSLEAPSESPVIAASEVPVLGKISVELTDA